MGDELSHVKADTARTHYCDLLAHRLIAFDRVDITHHLLVVDAGNIRDPGIDTRRHHNMVEASGGKLRSLDALTQFHGNSILLEHRTVVTQRLVELFLARHLLGQVELPTDFISRIKQCDGVSALGRHRGIGQPGRACTDYGDIFCGRGRAPLDHGLVTGAWIYQTGSGLHGKGVVETGLITSDTGVDFVLSPLCRLFHELGIGQHRSRHRHQISVTIDQHRLGNIGHVDAIGGDDRDRNFLAHPFCHAGKGAPWHHGGDGRYLRFVPSKVR